MRRTILALSTLVPGALREEGGRWWHHGPPASPVGAPTPPCSRCELHLHAARRPRPAPRHPGLVGEPGVHHLRLLLLRPIRLIQRDFRGGGGVQVEQDLDTPAASMSGSDCLTLPSMSWSVPSPLFLPSDGVSPGGCAALLLPAGAAPTPPACRSPFLHTEVVK